MGFLTQAIGAVAGGLPGFLIGSGVGSGNSNGMPDASSIPNYYSQPMNSELSGIQSQVNGLQAPTPVTATDTPQEGAYQAQGPFKDTGSTYQAKDYSNADLGYGAVQNQATQKLNTQNSGAQDAIQRRFAAMGNLNSGAYAKSAQMQDQSNAENVASTDTSIGFQQAQARNTMNQAEQNKEFQSGEAANQRGFAGQQAVNQENFQGSEDVANRNLQSSQANASRDMQASEFNTGNQMKNQEFQIGESGQLAGMDLGYKNAEQNQAEDQYNAQMNSYQAMHSGGLLGAGGFLGTGLGI